MNSIAVITTFPNDAWNIYAKSMLQSYMQFWPADIWLSIELDDDAILPEVEKLMRSNDAVAPGWTAEHKAFVERNKGKNDPQNYRKQGVRFCHKIFAIHRAMGAIKQSRDAGDAVPRYLVWMDADVITTSTPDFTNCLPKEGDAVAYLGRKDWDHSECGWLAFDLEKGGQELIEAIYLIYTSDKVFEADQWHDSYIWDRVFEKAKKTNLTPDAKGMDVWPQSPMGKWSTHYKGPEAKQKLMGQQPQQRKPGNQSNVVIQTRNSLPDEVLHVHIKENQRLIKNWINPCTPTDEEIIMVSAGPMLIPEEVRENKNTRIVAVKHAMEPLKQAGVKPWACILLDPRPHVHEFVKNPDKDVLWFVASQVDPEVTKTLLVNGCTVWGYHAAVGANEGIYTKEQPYSIIGGGTATATRGLFVLNHLGFSNFKLYGYDLCLHDKPNMNERDDHGQPKYLEISIAFNDKNVNNKKCFWTKPEFIAQFEELNEIIKEGRFNIEAIGEGLVPFVIKSKKVANLRNREFVAKIGKIKSYEEMLGCKTTWWANLRKWQRRILPKPMPDSKSLRY